MVARVTLGLAGAALGAGAGVGSGSGSGSGSAESSSGRSLKLRRGVGRRSLEIRKQNKKNTQEWEKQCVAVQ